MLVTIILPNFVQVREFLERFDSIPEMLDLDHLTVSGDVTFGKGVSLRVSKYIPAIAVFLNEKKLIILGNSAVDPHFTLCGPDIFCPSFCSFHSLHLLSFRAQ